jgi:hypothetical protein
MLERYGVPTRPFRLARTVRGGAPPLALPFPLFVKPAFEGSGKGVSSKSVCHNRGELTTQVNYLSGNLPRAGAHRDLSPGREFTLRFSATEMRHGVCPLSACASTRCRPAPRRSTATKRSGSGTRPVIHSISSSAPRGFRVARHCGTRGRARRVPCPGLPRLVPHRSPLRSRPVARWSLS